MKFSSSTHDNDLAALCRSAGTSKSERSKNLTELKRKIWAEYEQNEASETLGDDDDSEDNTSSTVEDEEDNTITTRQKSGSSKITFSITSRALSGKGRRGSCGSLGARPPVTTTSEINKDLLNMSCRSEQVCRESRMIKMNSMRQLRMPNAADDDDNDDSISMSYSSNNLKVEPLQRSASQRSSRRLLAQAGYDADESSGGAFHECVTPATRRAKSFNRQRSSRRLLVQIEEDDSLSNNNDSFSEHSKNTCANIDRRAMFHRQRSVRSSRRMLVQVNEEDSESSLNSSISDYASRRRSSFNRQRSSRRLLLIDEDSRRGGGSSQLGGKRSSLGGSTGTSSRQLLQADVDDNNNEQRALPRRCRSSRPRVETSDGDDDMSSNHSISEKENSCRRNSLARMNSRRTLLGGGSSSQHHSGAAIEGMSRREKMMMMQGILSKRHLEAMSCSEIEKQFMIELPPPMPSHIIKRNCAPSVRVR